eukprot:Rmarinus@m.11191
MFHHMGFQSFVSFSFVSTYLLSHHIIFLIIVYYATSPQAGVTLLSPDVTQHPSEVMGSSLPRRQISVSYVSFIDVELSFYYYYYRAFVIVKNFVFGLLSALFLFVCFSFFLSYIYMYVCMYKSIKV